MTKQEAISFFGGVPGLAQAIGTTRQAIYQWPDDLGQAKSDQVRGAALRLGKFTTDHIQAERQVSCPSDDAGDCMGKKSA